MTRFIEICLAAVVKAIGSLPIGFRIRAGRALGALAARIPSRDRYVAELQISRYLNHPDPKQAVRGVYINLGQVGLEAMNLTPLVRSNRIAFPNEAECQQYKDGTRPTIALTAHFGNWDLLAAYIASRGFPLTVIGRHARGVFQPILVELRRAYGVDMVWRTNGSQGAKVVCRALEANRIVAALIDQDTRVSSKPIPFFGVPAATPAGLIELGKRYNARFLTAFLARESSHTSTVIVEPIDESLSSERILSIFNSRLEELIRTHPEQWVWIHKRWRTQADGKRLNSREYVEFLEKALANSRP